VSQAGYGPAKDPRADGTAWNLNHRHINEFSFEIAQKQNFSVFISGSGRKNVVLGPIVGRLALFTGPYNTFHAVGAWAKTQATVTTREFIDVN